MKELKITLLGVGFVASLIVIGMFPVVTIALVSVSLVALFLLFKN